MNIEDLEARIARLEDSSPGVRDDLTQMAEARFDALIAIIKTLAAKDEAFAAEFRQALIARGRHGREALFDAYFGERNRLLTQLGLEPDRS